jgi:RimJ/RimL family protein N-acetyltransferase
LAQKGGPALLSKATHQRREGILELVPCLPSHAALVANWPASSTEVADWCELDEFPLPAQSVTEWNLDGVEPYILREAGEIVGYGEVWTDPEDDLAELGRIIVAPAARGCGIGRGLITRLLREARLAGYAEVVIRVHPDNQPALRCGAAVGFVQVHPARADYWNTIQSTDYIWLRHHEGTT